MAERSEPVLGPVVIGGVGGSGTRIFAEMASGLGFAMGRDLNGASDNLLFTLLFKRPRWFAAHWRDRSAIAAHLRVLETVLTGRGRLGAAGLGTLLAAAREMMRDGHTLERAGSGLFWAPGRVLRALLAPRPTGARGWGWKEPNSHLILDHLAALYPGLRYVHVIRHGLDMAFSGNQQQVGNWTGLFGMGSGGAPNAPETAYRYWVTANDRVMALGRTLGPERFLLLRLEEVCAEPASAVERLAGFLGAPLEPETRDRLARLPRMPDSVGRHLGRDLSGFAAEDLAALPRFGYDPVR